MGYGNKQRRNPALRSEIGITTPDDFNPSSEVNYIYKPTPPTVNAIFNGRDARCGACNHKLGEFDSANGVIQCPKRECKAKNKVSK